MKINLGETLTKAWKTTWKFKVLWIFGILASCAGGNSSNFNFNSSSRGGSGSGSDQLPQALQQFENLRPMDAAERFLGQYTAIIAVIIVLLCLLWLLFYFLGVMGQTGLIRGASQADEGAEKLGFGQLWSESTPYFWRVFGARMLVGLPIFLLVVILLIVLGFTGYSAYQADAGGMGVMLLGLGGIFIAAMCVIGLVSLVINMVLRQAEMAIVLEDLGVLPGLSRGWQVLKTGVLDIIIVALLLGVIGFVTGIIIALPLLMVLIPTAIGAAAAGAKNMILPLIIGGSCFVLYLPILVTLNGILNTFSQSVWTITFRQLTARPAPAPAPAVEPPAALPEL